MVDILLVLLLGGVLAAVLAVMRTQRRENRVLARTPVVALERSSEVYKIAQTSTRIMERLLDDDMVQVTIPASTKERMRSVIDQFYEL